MKATDRAGKSLAYRTAKAAMIASMESKFAMWPNNGQIYYFVKGKLNGKTDIPLTFEDFNRL